jgi:Uma2 family endonuclease
MATVTETPTVAPHLAPNGSSAPAPPFESRRRIGPDDHGRRMAFDEFLLCDFEEGHLYELARGVIIVTEVPGIHHGRIVDRVSRLFVYFDDAHPGLINYRACGSECRLRLPGMSCDRHPDQAVYLSPPPDSGPRHWTRWTPDIVVEIVSEGGEERDYVEKREEYLRAGVREYWILNPNSRVLHALQRAGDVWQEVTVVGDGVYACPLLPGLEVRPGVLFGPVGGE